MKSPLVICFLSISLIVHAQTSETKYYRSKSLDEEVPKERAKYSKTIMSENGVITTTTTNLKKDQIEFRNAWRDDEPVGKWITLTGTGPEELDYDFEIRYEESNCSNPEALRGISDYFLNNDAASYTAPVIDYKDPQFMSFIRHKLRYPAKARRTGVQGTVHLAFKISADGTIDDVVVTRGVDVVLDKEAVRVIRALKLSSPPMLKGKAQEVCVEMPLRFRLN